MSQNQIEENVTRCRDENTVTLQQYANNKRIADQFNDVTVVAGSESIPANRMVLSCYSKFFESMFLSPMKERYQNEVEIQNFDGKAVRALIDFMYSGKIVINNENVVNLLAVADFLQMEDVKLFCFEFLDDNLSIDDCLEMVNLSIQYNCPSSLKNIYQFISENFDQLAIALKHLPKASLVSLLSNIDMSKIKQSSVYNAILSWTQEDESRKADFAELFVFIKLPLLSIQFLEKVVSQEPQVRRNTDCLNALTSGIFEKLNSDLPKCNRILCVNGCNPKSVFEVYRLRDITMAYPSVPDEPRSHRVVKLDDFVYCVGGWSAKGISTTETNKTNKVFQLNLSKENLQWREVASMREARYSFGAAVYKGCLVVNGSGYPRTNTTEVYDAELNRWSYIASSKVARSHHELVVVAGALFAVGGHDGDGILSSVERLDDLNDEWRMVQSIKTQRHAFSAVACQKFVFAIGGHSTRPAEKTVEKYDPGNDTWIHVSSMNVERSLHAACVLQGKIYVVGGENVVNGVLKSVDCYNPELDNWTIVGETKFECTKHALVVL